MKIDSHIKNAIDQYVIDNHLSYDRMSELLKVSPATLTKWRRVGNGITKERWSSLLPLIKEYLPQDRFYIDDAGDEQYSSAASKASSYFFEPKYVPVMVPVFFIEQLKEYDNTIDSITQFGESLEANVAEYRPKHKGMSSVFAILTQDDSLAPVLPRNTKMFVSASEKPNAHNLVIALTCYGDVIVGSYNRNGDDFVITPFDRQFRQICGNIKDARKYVKWIFPVLYYEVVTF